MSIRIRIDDEPFEVALPVMTVTQLLELTGVSLDEHYIQRIEGNRAGVAYEALHDEVTVRDGDRFVTVYTGACTAQ